jgi:membrane peptidoglycan carboxypeptidase
VGFTNDVTVAVWLGYDNSDGKRRTLGGGATGGHVAVPIFEPVIQAVWAHVAPKTALAPPSPEAKRQLACKSIDLDSGEMQGRSVRPITECFRIDRSGQIIDTQYRLVSREDAYVARDTGGFFGINPNPFGYNGYYDQRQGTNPGYYYDSYGRLIPAQREPTRPPAQVYQQRDPRVQAAPQRDPYGRPYQPPQQVNPFFFWGNRW